MNSLLKKIGFVFLAGALSLLLISCAHNEQASKPAPPASLYADAAPLDLRLSKWPYPYPVKEFKTLLQGQPASMMYMDVAGLVGEDSDLKETEIGE